MNVQFLSTNQSLPSLVAFAIYLFIVMLIGVVAFIATRNLSDYVLGGRRLGGAVAALSAGASDMSSWLLMGLPGLVYVGGLSHIWLSLGLTLGAYTCWRLIAPRLRIYSELAEDSVTLPAFLDNRFRDTSKVIRLLAAIATLVFFIFYVASGLYASGTLLSLTFGLSYSQSLALGATIIMLYTMLGGFLAVSWTDFFQGNLMLVCLLLAPVFALQNMGGIEQALQKTLQIDPHYFEVFKELSFGKWLSLMSWGLGYFGMPHILVRFMAVKTVKEIPLARRVCIGWMALSLIGATLVGIVGSLQFYHAPLNNTETVFMALAKEVFSPWIVGVILAAILSSSMCAIDSQMLAASSALTEDFYKTFFRRNAKEKELMWIGRITVLLIAGVALYIARKPAQSIMDLVAFAWAGLGATFSAPVVFSLYWKRTTRTSVILAMLTGAGTVMIWRALGFSVYLYEILPATLASSGVLILTTLLGEPPSEAVTQEFEKMRVLLGKH